MSFQILHRKHKQIPGRSGSLFGKRLFRNAAFQGGGQKTDLPFFAIFCRLNGDGRCLLIIGGILIIVSSVIILIPVFSAIIHPDRHSRGRSIQTDRDHKRLFISVSAKINCPYIQVILSGMFVPLRFCSKLFHQFFRADLCGTGPVFIVTIQFHAVSRRLVHHQIFPGLFCRLRICSGGSQGPGRQSDSGISLLISGSSISCRSFQDMHCCLERSVAGGNPLWVFPRCILCRAGIDLSAIRVRDPDIDHWLFILIDQRCPALAGDGSGPDTAFRDSLFIFLLLHAPAAVKYLFLPVRGIPVFRSGRDSAFLFISPVCPCFPVLCSLSLLGSFLLQVRLCLLRLLPPAGVLLLQVRLCLLRPLSGVLRGTIRRRLLRLLIAVFPGLIRRCLLRLLSGSHRGLIRRRLLRLLSGGHRGLIRCRLLRLLSGSHRGLIKCRLLRLLSGSRPACISRILFFLFSGSPFFLPFF